MQRLDFKVIPLEQWSAMDREAWTVAIRPRRRRAAQHGLARYDEYQQRKVRAAFGRWLGFLMLMGHEPAGIRGAEHLTDDLLFAFVMRLHAQLSSYTVRTYMVELQIAALAMETNHDLRSLRAFTRDACRNSRAERDKWQRVVPIGELLRLGRDLMDQANQRNSSLGRARDFRDGLAIALLAALPLRISNFAKLELERHVLDIDGVTWIAIPACEVKNRRPLERRVPSELMPALTTYIESHRPRLLQQSGRWWREADRALWISEDGGPLGHRQLSARIGRRTLTRFGFVVNAHLFRDCAATSIATEDPAHVGIITPVLGHSRYRTGERFYNQASGMQAGRAYQEVLAERLALDQRRQT